MINLLYQYAELPKEGLNMFLMGILLVAFSIKILQKKEEGSAKEPTKNQRL